MKTKMDDLTPDELAEFEERAAILEFDGKMERDAAERMALMLTVAKRPVRKYG